MPKGPVVWILACETLDDSAVVSFRSALVFIDERCWVRGVSDPLGSPPRSVSRYLALLLDFPVCFLILLSRIFYGLTFFVTFVTNKDKSLNVENKLTDYCLMLKTIPILVSYDFRSWLWLRVPRLFLGVLLLRFGTGEDRCFVVRCWDTELKVF